MKATSGWDEILATYSPEKRQWDRTYPWIAFVLRPASFVITWLLPSWVTANQVTLLSYAVALASLLLMANGSQSAFVAGSVLLVLFNLIDCVDGNLARLRGSSSRFGRFLDALAFPTFILPYFVLGIGLARRGGSDATLVLAVGASTTILKLLVPDIRQIFHNSFGTESQAAGTENARVGHVGRWYYRLYYNLTDLQGHDIVLVAASLSNWVKEFLVLSFVVSIGEILAVLAFYIAKAWRRS